MVNTLRDSMHYWHIGKIPCKLTYLEPVEQYLLDGIIGFHNLVVSNSNGPPENTRYPRFDLSEIDYDVNCFIDKGSDVFPSYLKMFKTYIWLSCLRFVRYVLNVLFVSMNVLNKEILIHKTFIYYSMNLIFDIINVNCFKG